MDLNTEAIRMRQKTTTEQKNKTKPRYKCSENKTPTNITEIPGIPERLLFLSSFRYINLYDSRPLRCETYN
jgi:hypothetical protein